VHGILAGLVGLNRLRLAPQGRTVMVTSALPGEGKTSLSIALGRCAARAGLSVVLIECDLRRPTALAACGAPTAASGPPHQNLDKLPPSFAGPFTDLASGMHLIAVTRPVANPHGVLASPGLTELLNRLRGRYDLVILDTPPVLAFSDATRLAALVDDVVLASAWKRTPQDALVAAIRVLQRNGAPIAGIVFSKMRLRELTWARSARKYYARLPRQSYPHA
jgi:Mrp family chromosome partitioning ATPase